MMNKNNSSQRINFNILKYIYICLKSWRAFVACVLVCVFMAGVFSVFQTQKSQVMAQLLLKDDTGAGSSMMLAGQIARSFSLGDMFGGSSSTDNEVYVLASHAVMIATVKDLDLNISYSKRRLGVKWESLPQNSPLRLIVPDQMSDTITTALVFRVNLNDDGKINVKVKKKRETIAEVENQSLPATVNTPYGKFVIDKSSFFDTNKATSFKITYCSYSGAAQSLMKRIKIYVPDRKTDFIDISYVTPDPKFGIKVLNSLIDNYVDVSNLYKFGRTTQSLKLVDDRLATLSHDMVESEKSLEQFKIDNKLTDVEVDAQYLITKTGALEASLLEAQTNYELLKLTKDFISNPENKYSLIPELITGATGTADQPGLIASYNQMILERMELLNSAKSNNITVKQLDEQIDAMRANIVASVDRMYVNASVALRDIKSEDGRTKSRISELPALEREYITLKRDNMLMEQMYLFLLQQREELNMNINSTTYPAQVVDAPYVLSEEPGLTRIMLLILGAFIGVVLAALYVLLYKMKKAPVISASEIDSMLEAPGLQHLSLDSDCTSLAIMGDGPNSENFRQLRSDVQFALDSCDGKVVAVTSINEAEGKTYVAVNLAASLAAIGKKTLLVDAALRSPAVASVLGISNPSSALVDYVLSAADTSVRMIPVAVNDRFSLDVITATKKAVNASDIVASERFASLIDSLRSAYDYIIIDSTSVKGFSDIYHVTDSADVTLIVCKVKTSSPEDIQMINNLYSNARLKRIAVVENAIK